MRAANPNRHDCEISLPLSAFPSKKDNNAGLVERTWQAYCSIGHYLGPRLHPLALANALLWHSLARGGTSRAEARRDEICLPKGVFFCLS